MLLIEQLLMATGLLPPSTSDADGRESWQTDMKAAEGLLPELRAELLGALDMTKPAHLYVCPSRKRYFERLTMEPAYEDWRKIIEAKMGTEAADAYQAVHANARRVILDRRPSRSIDTAMGPMALPLDSISQGRWDIEVDVVEGLRLLKDLAAGALLKTEVDVFSACFPETYQYLNGELDVALADRGGRKKNWQPSMFIGPSLAVFEGKPIGSRIDSAAPKKPGPQEVASPKGAGSSKKTLNDIAESMKLPAQKAP